VVIIGGAVARIMFFVWGHRAISFAPCHLANATETRAFRRPSARARRYHRMALTPYRTHAHPREY
jgi:hypothetical protein